MNGRPARGALPAYARAVLEYVSAHPRTGWYISDLVPDGSKPLPSGYPPDRRRLERSLDTLVTRGLASREAIGWISRGRVLGPSGRNPTYVYFFPQIPPGKAVPLQVWMATDPVSADQTYNVRHGLPRKDGTPANVVEYLEVELLTPHGRGSDGGLTLHALLKATFPPIARALRTLRQPAMLVAWIGQSEMNRRGPGQVRTRKLPTPSGVTRIDRPTPLGTDPKKIRATKRKRTRAREAAF